MPRRQRRAMQVRQLFGVQFYAQTVALRGNEHALDLRRAEGDAFAEGIDRIDQPFAGQHRQHGNHQIDIIIAAPGKFGRQRMRAQESRGNRHPLLHAQRARGAQHPLLGRRFQAIARFDLDRGHAIGNQFAQARRARRDQVGLARRAGGAHCRNDPAAGARNRFVIRARQPRFEFARAIAAVDEVRMAIDQPRRDQAAPAIQCSCRIECRCIGGRSGIDDAAITRRNHRAFDHGERMRGMCHRQQASARPHGIDTTTG